MDPKKFEAMKVRVDGASGIAITSTHVDPQYSLQYSSEVDATKSAHIVLFSLTPNAPGLPIFRGRWDDAASAVDVDLEGPWPERLAFKWGRAGYSGHHTAQLSTSPRSYGIDIRIPSMHVFQGEITLGTKIGVKLEDNALNMRAEVVAVATIVKPDLIRRIARWLNNLLAGAFS